VPRIDPILGERARTMRRMPTELEKRLWEHLSRSQLGGFKFRRQAVLKSYIADFSCPSKGLIVEVDGETHEPTRDERRDRFLARHGFTTIRFTNREVHDNMDGMLMAILERLRSLPERWPGPIDSPTPCPSPEGEES